MNSKKPTKTNRRATIPPAGRTRGEAPMEVRQRVYPPRSGGPNRHQGRTQRTSSIYPPKRSGHRNNTNRQLSRELDERLVDLQALFEVSKTLNSSLHLKNILDTLLLTPMGKMMIGRGVVLLAREEKRYVIETLKGLPQSNIGTTIEIDLQQTTPFFLSQEAEGQPSVPEAWAGLLLKLGLLLVVPIIANNKARGMMVFSAKLSNNEYTPNELEYLGSLANLAATAVENGVIFQEMKELNRKLDKKNQELNTLFDIGKELNSTLDSEKISSVLAYALMGELVLQRCFIFAETEGKLSLQVNKGGNEVGLFNDEEFLNWLKTLKEPVNVRNSVLEHEEKGQPWREQLQAAGGVLLIPVKSQEVVRGVIMLGDKITKGEFSPEEIDFVSTLGNAAMISLENARLFQETLEKQRLEEELAIAREIQQRLLPKDAPVLKGYQIAALNIPTHKVGGDYFDYFPIDAQRYVLSIADVSGKGVPAALLMSNLQATLRAMMTADVPLERIVARINNCVHANTTYDKFITFFVGVLDLSNNHFTYVNAGHNPPYLFHRENGAGGAPEFRLLDKGGLLLGMFPNAPYEFETVALQDGDWLVMYTDGVSEAKNAEDQEFSESRIEEAIRGQLQIESGTAAGMIDTITNEVRKFTAGEPQSDDITLMAVHYTSSNQQ